ncbi:MAG: orotidine 5'-phosphate decarboxylase [Candidatus Brockarchaeota archaeon]|nr:orotidine 5'-phosphate decarboxylase [Candidatus Brockarchaeota archaeon]
MPRTKVQVALDTTCMSEALTLARYAKEGGADLIEAGTPLIKAHGMEAVRRLAEVWGEKPVVADMKTLDAGRVESELACKAGAKVVVVSGWANDVTVKEAVRAAESYGACVMVDLINVKEALERALEVESMGARYVCLHTGLDAQAGRRSVADSLDLIRSLSSKLKIPLAAAGGITAGNVRKVSEAGASLVVVGSFITKAPDPEAALGLLLGALG